MKYRRYLENYNCSRRGRDGDYRKKGAWAVFSYFDEKGIEYRKSFWALPNTPEETFWEIAPLSIT